MAGGDYLTIANEQPGAISPDGTGRFSNARRWGVPWTARKATASG
ncbi:MAG: hypothetical protein ACI9W2_003440, partial [Gammaproteobacteria bacterium]